MQITIDGEIFTGQPEKLIPVFEARGYSAQRNEQNPHPYWQVAEHLKKNVDQGNGNYHKRDENRGEIVRGNRKGNREKQVSSRGTLSQNGADQKGGTFFTQDIQAEDK